jgi:hypothetical protein
MKIFVSKIDKKFSINQIAKQLGMKYPLVHRSIKLLIEEKYLLKDEQDLIYLNYRANQTELVFIESLRKKDFLSKNKTFNLFLNDCLNNIQTDFFIVLLFGSSVEKNGRDIDLLFIFNKEELELNEKIVRRIGGNFTLNLDINTIPFESVYELFGKREQINVLNETINKHIILFGGENFYRMLKNARK